MTSATQYERLNVEEGKGHPLPALSSKAGEGVGEPP